jgi:hypothetical protein
VRKRLIFLIVTIFLGLLVFAIAYPFATSGGSIAAY